MFVFVLLCWLFVHAVHAADSTQFTMMSGCMPEAPNCVVDMQVDVTSTTTLSITRTNGTVTISGAVVAASAELIVDADTIVISSQIKCALLVLRARTRIELRGADIAVRNCSLDAPRATVAIDATSRLNTSFQVGLNVELNNIGFGGANGGLGGVPVTINGSMTSEANRLLPPTSASLDIFGVSDLPYGQSGFGVGGGRGGGVIWINADVLQLAGALRAAGGRATGNELAGGGSGGSIVVDAVAVNVTQGALIDVSGGTGSSNGGGGGGGGRVVFRVRGNSTTSLEAERYQLALDGGETDASQPLRNGGVGLFVLFANGDAKLYIRGSMLSKASGLTIMPRVPTSIVTNFATIFVEYAHVSKISNETENIVIGPNTKIGNSVDLSLSVAKNLTLLNDAILSAQQISINCSVLILQSKAKLSAKNSIGLAPIPEITTTVGNTTTVATTTSTMTTMMNDSTGATTTTTAMTPMPTPMPLDANSLGRGGSFIGQGGLHRYVGATKAAPFVNNNNANLTSIGNYFKPLILRGGDGEPARGVRGNVGGGSIQLNVNQEIVLSANAEISASGDAATRAGAGAGGSILIQVNNGGVRGAGTIACNGGAPSLMGNSGGGGGGGLVVINAAQGVDASVIVSAAGGSASSNVAPLSPMNIWSNEQRNATPGSDGFDGGAGLTLIVSRPDLITNARTLIASIVGRSDLSRLASAGATSWEPMAFLSSQLSFPLSSMSIVKARLNVENIGSRNFSFNHLNASLTFNASRIEANFDVSVANLILDSQSVLSADGLVTSPGPGTPASILLSEKATGGAGYGGNGARSSSDLKNPIGGPAYGTATMPLAGSCGGRFINSTLESGAGGGLITIQATNLIFIESGAEISARGIQGKVGLNSSAFTGGGSGGGILLKAPKISGSGSVNADGGGSSILPAQITPSDLFNGGGGGGGRLALIGFADGTEPNLTLSVRPGAARLLAGIGTIYMKSESGALDEVRFIRATPSFAPDNDAGTPWPAGEVPGALIENTFLSPDASRQIVLTTVKKLELRNAQLARAKSITISVGTDLVLDEKSFISVTAGGSSPMMLPQDGAVGSATVDGSGGGHGGRGLGANGGQTYGANYSSPTTAGGSGGEVSALMVVGATGGGVIQISVGRTLTLNGEILSNGANSPIPANLTSGVSAGAGAGGSIMINVVGQIEGRGLIAANGGHAARANVSMTVNNATSNVTMSFGQPGGGGRVAVRYGIGGISSSIRLQAFGGSRDQDQAGAGTIFISDTATFASKLIVSGNAMLSPSKATTLLQLNSNRLPRVELRDGANVVVPANDSIATAGVLTLSGRAILSSESIDLPLGVKGETVHVADGAMIKAGSVLSLCVVDIVLRDGGSLVVLSANANSSAGGFTGIDANSTFAGGGSNSGEGGSCGAFSSMSTPRNATLPRLLDNGGGAGGRPTALASSERLRGGGVLLLTATGSLTMANGGVINANGVDSRDGRGAGAGGSIMIVAQRILIVNGTGANFNESRITANGGSSLAGNVSMAMLVGGAGGAGTIGVVSLLAMPNTTAGLRIVAEGGSSSNNLPSCQPLPPATNNVFFSSLNDLGAGLLNRTQLLARAVIYNNTNIFVAGCENLICQPGKYASMNNSVCSPCPAGYSSSIVGANDNSSCQACLAGSFAQNNGSSGCLPCAPGSASNETAATKCSACAVGLEAPLFGSKNCTECKAGSFANATGTATCAPCPAGQSTSKTGQTSCGVCAKGSSTEGLTGATICASCKEGTYSREFGQARCRPCELGTYSNSTSTANCLNCAAGFSTLVVGSRQCAPCMAGEFAGAAFPACKPCPAGSVTSSPSQESCRLCAAGEAQPMPGSTMCITCPKNTFSTPGQANCTACPLGTYTSGEKSSMCTMCLAAADDAACAAADNVAVANFSRVDLGPIAACRCAQKGVPQLLKFRAQSALKKLIDATTDTVASAIIAKLKVVVAFLGAPMTTSTSDGATTTTSDVTSTLSTTMMPTTIDTITAAVRRRNALQVSTTVEGGTPSATTIETTLSTTTSMPTSMSDSSSTMTAMSTTLPTNWTRSTPVDGVFETFITFSDVGRYNLKLLFDEQSVPLSSTTNDLQYELLIDVIEPVSATMMTMPVVASSEPFPFFNEWWFWYAVGGIAGCIVLIIIIIVVICVVRRAKKGDDDNEMKPLPGSLVVPAPIYRPADQQTLEEMARKSATAALPPPVAIDESKFSSAQFDPSISQGRNSQARGFDPSVSQGRGFDPSVSQGGQRGGGGGATGLLPFEIPLEELTFEKEIGRGAFGVVQLGTWRDSRVAIKQLQIDNLTGGNFEKELKAFQDEAAVMKGLRPHANVILLLGITPPPKLCIVAEFCEGGALYTYLHNMQNHVDESTMIKFAKGIASGMSHLHTEGIIHRDLATRNILLSEGLVPKISDFGLSRFGGAEGDNQTKSDVGPLKWMAPEAIKNRIYGKKTDVWSYGVTVWEIIARDDPYRGMDPLTVATQVCYKNLRLEMPQNSPAVLLEIMYAVFQDDPNARPDFRQISKLFRDRGF